MLCGRYAWLRVLLFLVEYGVSRQHNYVVESFPLENMLLAQKLAMQIKAVIATIPYTTILAISPIFNLNTTRAERAELKETMSGYNAPEAIGASMNCFSP